MKFRKVQSRSYGRCEQSIASDRRCGLHHWPYPDQLSTSPCQNRSYLVSSHVDETMSCLQVDSYRGLSGLSASDFVFKQLADTVCPSTLRSRLPSIQEQVSYCSTESGIPHCFLGNHTSPIGRPINAMRSFSHHHHLHRPSRRNSATQANGRTCGMTIKPFLCRSSFEWKSGQATPSLRPASPRNP